MVVKAEKTVSIIKMITELLIVMMAALVAVNGYKDDMADEDSFQCNGGEHNNARE